MSNAKYVYNEILKYFATQPDKLFVVITAPPLIHSANAANARAFNLWLVEDWLVENQYTLNNVAVFDFYNVLTGHEHHHRVVNGAVEYTHIPGQDLLSYPLGDDHPSQVGNLKATEAFVPLLNSFFNRWIATYAPQMPEVLLTEPAEIIQTEESEISILLIPGAILADFDDGSAFGWETFVDEGGHAQLDVAIASDQTYEGAFALHFLFDVAQEGWGTYAHFFDESQDWSAYNRLSFALKNLGPGGVLDVHVYAGTKENLESYSHRLDTTADMGEWALIGIPWHDFSRVAWEENPGSAFSKTSQIWGIAFGFPDLGKGVNRGELWIDSVQLLTDAPITIPETDQRDAALADAGAEEQTGTDSGGIPFCGGILVFPLVLAVCGLRWKKPRVVAG